MQVSSSQPLYPLSCLIIRKKVRKEDPTAPATSMATIMLRMIVMGIKIGNYFEIQINYYL